MADLRRLELEEDVRMKELLEGFNGFASTDFGNAPQVLKDMVAYCTNLRQEHTLLLNANGNLVAQNNELIEKVKEF